MSVDHVEVYQDESDEWRWRAIAANEEIVATGESHTRATDAARAAKGVLGEDVPIETFAVGPEPTEGPVEE